MSRWRLGYKRYTMLAFEEQEVQLLDIVHGPPCITHYLQNHTLKITPPKVGPISLLHISMSPWLIVRAKMICELSIIYWFSLSSLYSIPHYHRIFSLWLLSSIRPPHNLPPFPLTTYPRGDAVLFVIPSSECCYSFPIISKGCFIPELHGTDG